MCKSYDLYPSKVIADISEYKAKLGLWSRESLWKASEHVCPLAWWKGLCGQREVTKLAVILLNLPSTSVPWERNWSTVFNVKKKKKAICF